METEMFVSSFDSVDSHAADDLNRPIQIGREPKHTVFRERAFVD